LIGLVSGIAERAPAPELIVQWVHRLEQAQKRVSDDESQPMHAQRGLANVHMQWVHHGLWSCLGKSCKMAHLALAALYSQERLENDSGIDKETLYKLYSHPPSTDPVFTKRPTGKVVWQLFGRFIGSGLSRYADRLAEIADLPVDMTQLTKRWRDLERRQAASGGSSSGANTPPPAGDKWPLDVANEMDDDDLQTHLTVVNVLLEHAPRHPKLLAAIRNRRERGESAPVLEYILRKLDEERWLRWFWPTQSAAAKPAEKAQRADSSQSLRDADAPKGTAQ
jgi:hypothetical protein